MFSVHKIVFATKFLQHFRKYAKHFEVAPEPILIIQRKGIPLVLMPAALYEEALHESFKGLESEALKQGMRDI